MPDRSEFAKTTLVTGELEDELIEWLTVLVAGYREERKTLTGDVVKLYMTNRALKIIIYH